ncbi:MAG: PAS domain S-box protein [Nitrospirae bacterium]|nr:PAS domain S-box protein [Nitrospirota bacterium]
MTFRDRTIKTKLTAILMSVGVIAVFLACIVFYVMTTNNFREAYDEDLGGLARVIGRNCEASLAFMIPDEAERVLASLSVRPSVVYAVVRDGNGKPFASYGKEPKNAGLSASSPGQVHWPGHISVHQGIEVSGNAIGSVTLVDDMRVIRKSQIAAVSMMLLAMLVSIIAAFLMVPPLQRFISDPILALSSSAERIAKERDFSLRAEKTGDDEVGRLVDSFNAMIGQIEERNAELQSSEKRFRTLVDQAVDSFFLFDTDGLIVDVNQRACDTLGYRREELLGMTVGEISPALSGFDSAEAPWGSLKPLNAVTNEGVHRRKDGTDFPVEMRVGLMDIGGQRFIMGLARDISERREAESERRKLEAQLQQAQKMEAIGVLAGGIAHDFNNILSAIIGYATLAQMKIDADTPAFRDIEQVHKASNRAADMVKQILAFSRQARQERAPVDIRMIIKEAVKLLRASIPVSIEIRQNINASSGSVLADPTQIHQILMNLCTNAYHAMREKGGVLDVSLDEARITGNDISAMLNLEPGSYLRLTVSDTGHGMDKATADRIFEPYFTTKPPGEGTGLGLSVVHGIVKSCNGHISVYSEPGLGTSFHVYLPSVGAASEGGQLGLKPLEHGTEHLLIVDDEEQIVLMEKEMLAGLGYTITACSTPEQALEAFRVCPGSYDLVITDMTMPHVMGTDLALEMLRIRPDIPVILCTGFSDLVDEKTAKSLGIREFVMKPILLTSLAGIIRKVMDEAGRHEA